MQSGTDDLVIHSIELEKWEIGLQEYISEDAFLDPSITLEREARVLKMKLRDFVWSEPQRKHEIFAAYPDTWWQHFKRDYFPEWALRRWPVRYRRETATFDIRVIYPDLKISVPDEQWRVHYSVSTDWDNPYFAVDPNLNS